MSKDTRFKKGQPSANPGGRPRTKIFTEILREEVAAIDPKTGQPQARLLARALIAKGKRGFVGALTEIADRLEGKVALPVQVETITEETIKVIAELATTYNLLDDSGQQPALTGQSYKHPFGCDCVTCGAQKRTQRELEDGNRLSQAKTLTAAEVAVDTAKLMQQARDLESAKVREHEGPPYPSI